MFTRKQNIFFNVNLNLRHIQKVYKSNGNLSVVKVLQDYFGIDSYRALNVIEKSKRKIIDTEAVIENLNMFRSWGFQNNELLRYPKLIMMCTLQLEQRYLYTKECGFSRIIPYTIASFRMLQQKLVIDLKESQHIPAKLNVAENLTKYLKPLPKNFDVSDLTDKNKLNEIHMTIVKRYLMWRLQISDDEIEKIFRIYKMINNKSLDYLCQNIALAEEIGFTRKKIVNTGYILHNYPKYTKTMLEEFPNFAGADMKTAMRRYPKLMMVSPKQYLKIYGILKGYNISDEAIQKAMNIFTLSPETVKFRLQTISEVPELKVLLTNPRILRLVVHHNRATSRLSYLQQMELKCTNLLLLESDRESIIESYIREGQDVNLMKEVLMFLKGLFKISTRDLKDKLKRHPFHLHIPLLRMEETFHYLLERKFSKSAIYNVVQILLYPKQHIEKALEEIKTNKNESHGLSQVQKLNLILYYMEKEYHFTGNGVWLKSDENIG